MSEEQAPIEYQEPVFADLTAAPLPTKSTLLKRQCVPLQLVQFAHFNMTIMKMVITGHK